MWEVHLVFGCTSGWNEQKSCNAAWHDDAAPAACSKRVLKTALRSEYRVGLPSSCLRSCLRGQLPGPAVQLPQLVHACGRADRLSLGDVQRWCSVSCVPCRLTVHILTERDDQEGRSPCHCQDGHIWHDTLTGAVYDATGQRGPGGGASNSPCTTGKGWYSNMLILHGDCAKPFGVTQTIARDLYGASDCSSCQVKVTKVQYSWPSAHRSTQQTPQRHKLSSETTGRVQARIGPRPRGQSWLQMP